MIVIVFHFFHWKFYQQKTLRKVTQVKMTSLNRMSGYSVSQYNQAFDAASNDRNSQIFWDALSMASGSDRNSIALSIYHSVPELHEGESARHYMANGNTEIDKVK